jgi:3-oxoacyl-[acyl-carrier protein] reductase
MGKLANKVAVVSGASKGIGAAIAKSLAAEGAAVVVNYASSKEGAEKVVAEIKGNGGKAITVQGDFSKQEDIAKVFAEAKKTFGRVDTLVNNAGVYAFSPIEQIDQASLDRIFGLNVFGLILASQEAVKHFGDEGGSIINIGSVVSSIHPPNSTVYTATKGAVDAVTRVLAKELGPKKIRVNSINPGMVETEGAHTAGIIGSDLQKWAESQTPLGRIGQPNDIGPIAAFLASDDARWLTGELILAGGGTR